MSGDIAGIATVPRVDFLVDNARGAGTVPLAGNQLPDIGTQQTPVNALGRSYYAGISAEF